MYFYLKEPNSDKESLIYLIYYVKTEPSKNKYFKFSTKKKIHPSDWSFESKSPLPKRGGGGKSLKQLNLILSQYSNFLEDVISDAEKEKKLLTKSFLKILFDKEFNGLSEVMHDNDKLVDVIDLFIEKKSSSKGVTINWVQKYRNLKNKIHFFDLYNENASKFESINDDWLDSYCGFLRSLPVLLKDKKYRSKVNDYTSIQSFPIKLPKEPYNDNTLNRHVNLLFTFLKWAEGKYHDLDLKNLNNPVGEFQPEDVHLTINEIKKLESIILDNIALERVRDVFLVGVYSGQRYSDYSIFEKADVVKSIQGDMIIKKSEKMEDESYIPIHAKLKVILEKYNWKLPRISSQKFNPHIQAICRKIGMHEDVKTTNYIGNKKEVSYKQKCDMVTSHTARRTFITLSAEMGVPDHIIMKITGIKDVKTLDKYKKTAQRSVVDFMNSTWGKI
jgi:integrase